MTMFPGAGMPAPRLCRPCLQRGHQGCYATHDLDGDEPKCVFCLDNEPCIQDQRRARQALPAAPATPPSPSDGIPEPRRVVVKVPRRAIRSAAPLTHTEDLVAAAKPGLKQRLEQANRGPLAEPVPQKETPSMTKRTCLNPECRKDFYPPHQLSKYCSVECRGRANYLLKRGDDAPHPRRRKPAPRKPTATRCRRRSPTRRPAPSPSTSPRPTSTLSGLG